MKSDIETFYDEVWSWIKLEPLFSNMIVERELSWPPIVKIKPENGKPLQIALISLDDWTSNAEKLTALLAYHKKQQDLRNEGFNSVILWEDVWRSKIDIVKSRIASLLGISKTIPARLTRAGRVDKKLAHEFLDRNHMQGNPSSKFRYGLFLPRRYFRVLPDGFPSPSLDSTDLLVAVATFSAPRIFSHDDRPHRSYELIRFANLLDITVVGGFDKLIKYFINDIKPDDIMTYADLEWSDGMSYQKLGFHYVSDKEPMEIFLDTNTLTRSSLKNGSPDDINLVKVVNAGSRKFVKTVSKE